MSHQNQGDQHQQPYVQPGEPLHEFLKSFWQRQIDSAERETTSTLDYRHPPLPLARIKKVMKSDPEVKMIATATLILFCKACEIFVAEITSRAFIVADSHKDRTITKQDVTVALKKSDMFDFLIDVLYRPGAENEDAGDEDTGDSDAGDEEAGDEEAGDEDVGDEDAGDEDAGDESSSGDEGETDEEDGDE